MSKASTQFPDTSCAVFKEPHHILAIPIEREFWTFRPSCSEDSASALAQGGAKVPINLVSNNAVQIQPQPCKGCDWPFRHALSRWDL